MPAPLSTRHHVLILQHPQEPDHELGTAKLAQGLLPCSTLKVGLSWRNLSAALGREAKGPAWAVLYLGSGIKTAGQAEASTAAKPGLHFVAKSGALLPAEKVRAVRAGLEGIVLLDGTWSQSKALWWRNAWLLKLNRAILVPSQKSLYGALRREPRKECLSTIESIAEALTDLGESAEVGSELRGAFKELLNRSMKKDSNHR